MLQGKSTMLGMKGGHNILLWVLSAALFVIIGIVCAVRPNAAPGNAHVVMDLSKVLVPFVAVATAIERFWETVFDWYESFALSAARLIGISEESSQWITAEFCAAETAVANVVHELGMHQPGTPEYDRTYALFQRAEARLQDAQTRINEGLKSPAYVGAKRAITLLGSLVLGLIISLFARLQLFTAAGFSLETNMDILLTGLLIGAGPGPLHQVLGALQEFRNALGGVANLAQGTAIKRASEAVGQSAATAGGQPSSGSSANTLNLMVTSVPPARAQSAAATADGDEKGAAAVGSADSARVGKDPTTPPPPINTLAMQREASRFLKR